MKNGMKTSNFLELNLSKYITKFWPLLRHSTLAEAAAMFANDKQQRQGHSYQINLMKI